MNTAGGDPGHGGWQRTEEDRAEEGRPVEAARVVAAFLEDLDRRGRSPNTRRAYQGDLAGLAAAVPPMLAAISSADIAGWLAEGRRLSAATRARREAAARSFFRYCVRQGLVTVNPMEALERARVPERLPRPLPAPAVQAILDAIPPRAVRDRALFWLLRETGMRVGEALGLQVSDVDLTLDAEQLRVTGKGGRTRVVVLAAAPQSVRLLRRYLKVSRIAGGALFRGNPARGGTNQAMDYTTARRAWQRYCRSAGVTATIHQLRHSRATELVRGGVPLGTVRKLLGHRNLQTTLLYAEISDDQVRRDLLEFQRRR